ncbi:hypothetical protein TanjilG_30543 [Lupinus angustifolius]|uniref:Uncharacterized protein n=1 Tax=Lupinus angustifolius TaxID=3871 RepID=A0A394DDF3_LUPAN|nr:hypothetical protein TanjilG_30543 [Lupinus angustifolius]
MSSNSLQHRCKVIEDGFKCQQWKRKCTINAISDGQSIEPESQAPDKKSMKDSVKDGLTVVASVLMIIVNCGLNELCDLEIDKINKPHLPLTSGALSIEAGIAIVAASAFLGLWLSWMSGSWPLFCNVLYNNVLAVVYSVDLPLLRWKKSSFLTAIYILTNIGVVIPIGSFLHIQDIPDMEGDEKYGIKSLTLRLGQKQVLGHATLALVLQYRAKSVDPKNKDSVQSFYMFIWKQVQTLLRREGYFSVKVIPIGEKILLKGNIEENVLDLLKSVAESDCDSDMNMRICEGVCGSLVNDWVDSKASDSVLATQKEKAEVVVEKSDGRDKLKLKRVMGSEDPKGNHVVVDWS